MPPGRGWLPRGRHRRRALAAFLAATAVLLLGCLAGYAWGARAFAVSSPSMGIFAPRGSLVVTVPLRDDPPVTGDVVTLRRGADDAVLTHRVVATTRTHVTTKGDTNGSPDPVPTPVDHLIGRVQFTVPNLGFAVATLRVLVPALAVLWLITWRLSARWRPDIRFLGACVIAQFALRWQMPFLSVAKIGEVVAQGAERAQATIINTGALPARISVPDGQGVDLYPGARGLVTGPVVDGALRTVPHLFPTLPWLVALLILAGGPLLYAFATPDIPDDEQEDEFDGPRGGLRSRIQAWRPSSADSPPGPAAWVRFSATALAAWLVVCPFTMSTSQAAFTAQIANTSTSTTSGTWGCWPAYGASNPFLLYRLGDTTSTAEDKSINAHHGSTKWKGAGPAQPATLGAGNAGVATNACRWDEVATSVFKGNNVLHSGAGSTQNSPGKYSIELWFRTETPGGTLVTFGSTKAGYTYPESDPVDGLDDFDRSLYVTKTGRLNFAIYESGPKEDPVFRYLKSPTSYINGAWHHVVVTVDSDTHGGPMIMYVDGAQVDSDTTTQFGPNEVPNGHWRWGAGPLWCFDDALIASGGVRCANEKPYYTGSLSFAAIYNRILTPAEVAAHYAAR